MSTGGPIDACDWPMWGYSPAADLRHRAATPPSAPTPSATSSGSGSTPPTTSSPPRPRSWATRSTSATGPAWSTPSTGRPARSAGASRPPSTATSTPARSCPALPSPTSTTSGWVFIGAGKTLYALDAATARSAGTTSWASRATTLEPTEIESSPVVVGDVVLVGYDVHNTPGYRAGLIAFDATSGDVLWDFDPDAEGGQSAERHRVASTCGPRRRSTRSGGWSSPPRATARPRPRAGATTPRRSSPSSSRPASRSGPTSPTSPTTTTSTSPAPPTSSRSTTATSSAWATRTATTTWSTGRPARRSGRSRPPSPASRRRGPTSRPAASSAAPRSATAWSSAGPASGPCPCAHGIDAATGELALAERGAGQHLRGVRRGQRRAVPRRQRLHVPGPRPGDRRDPLVRGDAGRGVGRLGGQRRRRLRRGRHPGARPRRALRDQRRLPLLARRARRRAGRDDHGDHRAGRGTPSTALVARGPAVRRRALRRRLRDQRPAAGDPTRR